MRLKSLIRRALKSITLPAFCTLAMGYFGYHALVDDHGLRRLIGLHDTVADRQHLLETEQSKRAAMEAKVQGLNSERIDPDLLDERARETLGLAKPGEIIIYKQK